MLHPVIRFPALTLLLALLVSLPAVSQQLANDYYEDARRYHGEGDREAALIQLKNALARDDQHVPSLLLTGDIQLEMGDSPAAEFVYGEALLLGADANYATPRLAEAYLAQQKHREIMQLNPDQLSGASKAELLGYRSLVQLRERKPEASEKTLEQALAINPESRVPNIVRAQYLLEEGRPEEARRISQALTRRYPYDARSWAVLAASTQALGREPEAVEAYSQALELNPHLTSARLARAALYQSTGKLDAATVDVDFVRADQPGNPKGAFMKAQLLDQAGQESQAKDAYRHCAELLSMAEPDFLAGDLQLTMLAAISHIRIGEFQQAISYLQAYQARDALNPQSGELLTSLLLANDSAAAALSLLDPMLEATPDDPELLALKAQILNALGRYEQALALWRQLIEMGHGDIDMEVQIAHSQLLAGQTSRGIEGLEKVLRKDGNRPQEIYLLATTRLQQGEYREAASLAARLVKLEPGNPEFHNFLGRSHMYAGDLALAHRQLSAATAKFSGYLPILLTLAEVETAQGDLVAARKRLVTLAETHPTSGEVMLQRARVERLDGDLGQARKWAEKARVEDFGWFEPRRFLVYLLLEMDEQDAAEEMARETLARDTDDMEARFLLAKVLVARGENTKALTAYQSMAGRPLLGPAMLYRIGREQAKLGAYDDASSSLYRAAAAEPDNFEYRRAHIQAELYLANYDLALRLASELHRDFPDSAVPHALMGAVYGRRGLHQEAEQQYALAVSKDGENRDLLIGQYRALRALGETDRAEQVLTSWLEHSPDDDLVNYAYAELLINAGRWPDAEKVLSSMLQRQPGNALVLNNLAFVLQQMGRPEALEYARQAQSIAPGVPQINDTLGWILVRDNQSREGLSYLREAVARQAEDPAFRYHLAVALNDLGRQSEAAEELGIALGQSAEFDGRAEAEKLYAEIR